MQMNDRIGTMIGGGGDYSACKSADVIRRFPTHTAAASPANPMTRTATSVAVNPTKFIERAPARSVGMMPINAQSVPTPTPISNGRRCASEINAPLAASP